MSLGRSHVRDIDAVHKDRTGRGHKAADGVEQSRLARTVGTDETNELALTDLKRHTVDCNVATEPNFDVLGAHRRRITDYRSAAATARRWLGNCRYGSRRGRFRQTSLGSLKEAITSGIHDLQQAAWKVHEQNKQPDIAREEVLEIAKPIRGHLGDAANPQRPEYRTGDRAESTNDCNHNRLQRLRSGEVSLGVKAWGDRDEKAAGKRRHAARHCEGRQLDQCRRDRRCGCHLLVVPNGNESPTDAGGPDPRGEPCHHSQRDETEVVHRPPTLAEVDAQYIWRGYRPRHRGPTGKGILHQQPASGGDSEGEGDNGQEQPSHPQRRESHEHSGEHPDACGQRNRCTPGQGDRDVKQIERHWKVVTFGESQRAHATDAHERKLTERQLTGPTSKNCHRKGDHGPDQDDRPSEQPSTSGGEHWEHGKRPKQRCEADAIEIADPEHSAETVWNWLRPGRECPSARFALRPREPQHDDKNSDEHEHVNDGLVGSGDVALDDRLDYANSDARYQHTRD